MKKNQVRASLPQIVFSSLKEDIAWNAEKDRKRGRGMNLVAGVLWMDEWQYAFLP